MGKRNSNKKLKGCGASSLCGRPLDVLFIFFFGAFAVIAITIDIVQSTGGYLQGNELRTVDNWREEFKDHKLLPGIALEVTPSFHKIPFTLSLWPSQINRRVVCVVWRKSTFSGGVRQWIHCLCRIQYGTKRWALCLPSSMFLSTCLQFMPSSKVS